MRNMWSAAGKADPCIIDIAREPVLNNGRDMEKLPLLWVPFRQGYWLMPWREPSSLMNPSYPHVNQIP